MLLAVSFIITINTVANPRGRKGTIPLWGTNYRPQTMFAKVMFLHLSVSHSVHKRRGVCIQGEESASRLVCIWGGSAPHRILLDTVNERAVSILLECIFVL